MFPNLLPQPEQEGNSDRSLSNPAVSPRLFLGEGRIARHFGLPWFGHFTRPDRETRKPRTPAPSVDEIIMSENGEHRLQRGAIL
jgi:hypothetical protein